MSNIEQTTIDKIRELARVTSAREISRMLGVSRYMVQLILAGGRPCARPPKPPWPLPDFRRPVVRCGNCGRLVHLPCLACNVEALSK